jgi:hypothetical protein
MVMPPCAYIAMWLCAHILMCAVAHMHNGEMPQWALDGRQTASVIQAIVYPPV